MPAPKQVQYDNLYNFVIIWFQTDVAYASVFSLLYLGYTSYIMVYTMFHINVVPETVKRKSTFYTVPHHVTWARWASYSFQNNWELGNPWITISMPSRCLRLSDLKITNVMILPCFSWDPSFHESATSCTRKWRPLLDHFSVQWAKHKKVSTQPDSENQNTIPKSKESRQRTAVGNWELQLWVSLKTRGNITVDIYC